MSEDLLCHMQSRRVDQQLSHRMPKHMRCRMNTEPSRSGPKRRLESWVAQRTTLCLTSPDPQSRRIGLASFSCEVFVQQWPPIAGNRNTMLVAGTFQQHCHCAAPPIDIGESKPEDTVPAMLGAPITNPLSGSK